MLTLATWLTLHAAVSSAPLVLPRADSVMVIGDLTKIDSTVEFLNRAGRYSALFRPQPWGSQMVALLEVDVTNPKALEAVGIDQTGWVTRSARSGATVSCFRVLDEAKLMGAVSAKLERLGTVSARKADTVKSLLATDALDRILGAISLQGSNACIAEAVGVSLKQTLPDIDKLLKAPQAKDANLTRTPFAANFKMGDHSALLALQAKEGQAIVDGKISGLRLPVFAGPGSSPFGATKSAGLATVAIRLDASHMGPFVSAFFATVPGGASFQKTARALTPLLTGNALLLVERLEVKGPLRTERQRFFALKFALLAEVNDLVKAKEVANGLPQRELSFAEGKVSAGVNERFAYFSNDPAALKAVLGAATAGTQLHSVEGFASGPLVARGLAQIPLLEVLQTPQLAALVGAGAELGSLLSHSSQIQWSAEKVEPRHIVQLRWSLDGKE